MLLDFLRPLPFSSFFCTDTDEELEEWKTKFEERILLLEVKIKKLEREMNDIETKSSSLNQLIKDSIRDISKLQTEAEVKLLISSLDSRKHFILVKNDYILIFLLFNFRLICP